MPARFFSDYEEDELMQIEAIIIRETDRAVLVKLDENDLNEVWLPVSQIETEKKSAQWGGGEHTYIITLPQWLAKREGLI